MIATKNPATGETIKIFKPHTDTEIQAKITKSQQVFEEYRHISIEQKSVWMNQIALILEAEKEELAKILTLEMGKTYKSAIAEIEKCANVCRYYAENAAQFLADIQVQTDAKNSFIRFQPLGIILAVMPWNFPFWQVFRFAAPALMAGNVGLLKHASNVPQCALEIERIITKAGFPKGAFQTLLIPGSKVAEIVSDDRVKAATLTGSEAAGSSLASLCGQYLKKIVLELGGSDPFIVLESADLEIAANMAVTARMLNNGQSCIAAKRFIVQEAIAPQFQQLLIDKFAALKIGDPMSPETNVGPLATAEILQELDQQVQKTVQLGGKILIGGKSLTDQPGNYYLPTIITDIPLDSPGFTEEFFGPVALFFTVKDLDHAIKLANCTTLGLGASAWTNMDAEKERLIAEIEAGAVFINGLTKSDPRLPFGGIKRSGYGRELGIYGMQEFLNIKTIWMN